MNDPKVFDDTVSQIPQDKFRDLLRKLRGEDRTKTSTFSTLVSSGPDRLTPEQFNALKKTLAGYLPANLLETAEEITMAATAVAGRSVQVR